MSDEERNESKIYTGTTSLDKLAASVVMFGDKNPPTKIPISEQKYARLKSWMSDYSKRYLIEGNVVKPNGIEGLPIFPSEKDLKKEVGLPYHQFKKIILGASDIPMLVSCPTNMPSFGIKKGVNYLIIESLYPEIFSLIKNKETVKLKP